MTDLNAPEYYRRRERQERVLAKAAKSSSIAAIHLDLAERYASMALRTEAQRGPRLRLVTV